VAFVPNLWKGVAGLPRQAWVLFATTLVNRSGTMVLPFLVLYLTRDLGFPAARAGLTLTIYGAFALAAAPLAGRLCDRVGHLLVMKISLIASGALLLAFPLARSWPAVIAATAVLSLATEAYRPAHLAVLSDLVPPERRKALFALNRLAINLGMSVGPAVGGFLVHWSFRALFVVDGVTSILAGALLVLLAPAAARAHIEAAPAADAAAFAGTGRAAHRDPRFLFFLAACLPVIAVFFQHAAAMPLYLVRDLELPESFYGLVFTANTLLIVLLEVQINTATARWHHGRTLALGSMLVAAGFGALALARGPASVMATVVVWTFGEMVLLPGMAAYAAEAAPAARRGEYMGLYTMSFGAAFTLGPWVGTVILDRFGPSVLWATMFALGMLSAAGMSRLRSGSTPSIPR
jgi:MFS family permease